MENLHEFLARDGLSLDQELGDLVKGPAVLREQALRLLIGLLEDGHDLMVHLRGGLVAAVHDHLPVVKILVRAGLKSHQAELFGHTVLGDHRAGDPCRVLNVVGGACGDRIKDDLLRRASGHGLYEHGADLFFRVQELLFLRHVHDVAQGTHGARYDGDLLDRLGVLLQGAHQSVPHLVVGYDPALFRAQDPVLLLLADQDDFHSLEKIRLADNAAALLDGEDGGLVDHVREVGTDGAGGGQRDLPEVDGLIHAHVLCMDAEDLLPSLQVGLVHDHAAVKTARTQERLVEDLRAVGCRQDEQSAGSIETVHLSQKLIECLLALVIAAAVTAVAVFADRVDLIDKNDTGRVLFRLLEKVADTGRADADEHLDELRSRKGEERALRLARNGLRKERLACSGRADEQGSLGELRADL